MRILTVALMMALAGPVVADEKPDAQRPQQLAATLKVQMGYLLALPADYEKQDQWPLLLFLHGSGERGDNLDLVKKHGPPKLIAEGSRSLPLVDVSPQCASGKTWEPFELVALLEEVSRMHKVDPDRIYVTGLSMGGGGTWRLAAYAPDRLAAIAPICGAGDPFAAERYAHIPCWAFLGAKDSVKTVERMTATVDALKKASGDPKFTIYPDAGHDAWTETYNNPAFYEWLLKQKRQPKK